MPDGHRDVTVFIRVKNLTPSGPCMWWSPNSERFHPPKLWYAVGTGIGTFTPTIPIRTRWVKSHNAAVAACTAWSTSPAVANGTCAWTRPVAGS